VRSWVETDSLREDPGGPQEGSTTQAGHVPLPPSVATVDCSPRTAVFSLGMHCLPNFDSLRAVAARMKDDPSSGGGDVWAVVNLQSTRTRSRGGRSRQKVMRGVSVLHTRSVPCYASHSLLRFN